MRLVLFAVNGLSFAAGPQGVHEPGTGIVSPETKEYAQGTGQGLVANAENAKNESAASAPQAQPGFEAALALFWHHCRIIRQKETKEINASRTSITILK